MNDLRTDGTGKAELALLTTQQMAMADRVATPSPAALARFGVPSVAEAAALAAFDGRARLVVPRRAEEGVTIAVAEEILE